MYFFLKEECVLVEGMVRGAIYDFTSGRVYSINRGAVELLKACRENSLEELLDFSVDSKYLAFLDQLLAKGLGEKTDTPPPQNERATPQAYKPSLEFVWLELTSSCNNKCLHCYSESSPQTPSGSVFHERWLELISEARKEGAYGIQLIGGEPLMYPKWRELVIKACEENYELIEIFTNATLVDDDCIDFFKNNNVSIATTIYANNAAVHDKVTQNSGSFVKTMSAIHKIIDNEIPLRIASIIMKANENEVENILNLYSDLGLEPEPPDVVRPTGRGDDQELTPSVYSKPLIRPPFYTDPETFAKSQSFHNCLAGRLAITAEGNVLPCIFARNQVCGNIVNSPLKAVLNGQSLQQCWQTSKNCINKCKDCEYRYACADCRPLAQGLDPNKCWQAAPVDCPYNPYTGKWEDDK